jgi:hypothetical protein
LAISLVNSHRRAILKAIPVTLQKIKLLQQAELHQLLPVRKLLLPLPQPPLLLPPLLLPLNLLPRQLLRNRR